MNENLLDILIVDDIITNIQFFAHALRANYKIRFATSGKQALSLVDEQIPDLILLDVKMPEMDGHEVHRILRSNPRTSEIPVIFVTADPNEEGQLRGLSEGADEYITKPVMIPALLLRIRKLLERQQLWRELKQQRDQLDQERARLREEYHFINALLNTTNSLILVIDEKGMIIRFNHAAEVFSGYLLNEVQEQPFFLERFILPEQLGPVREVFTSFLEGKLIPRSRNYWINRNGQRRLFDWSNSIFIDDNTGNRYLMEIGTDITEQRLTEYALQESLHEYATLVTMIPLGVYKFRMKSNGSWIFEFVTPQFCAIIGLSAGELYKDAQLAFKKIHEDDRDEFIALNHTVSSTLTKFEWEGRFYKTEDEIRWIHIESLPTIIENGDILWHGIQYDITERKEQEKKLDRIAHYDTLTGVPNRRLLADRMKQALARAQRNNTLLGVCYLDLDSFKPVNDQFGHASGDKLLIEITCRLQNILRGGDTLARLGGDEFVLVLSDLNTLEQCKIVLQRILVAVSTPVNIGSAVVVVSASIGVTLYPQDNSDADTLLRHADHAMYQAKELGKNRYDFFKL
ncbi:two-component system, cell cycle response regulator [Gammaproteobacteria bacterium]